MTATNSVEPAKDGNGAAFNITVAAESVSGNKAQKTYIGEPVGETIITPAQDGTDGTGITAPTGAVGIRGWLSGIFSKVSLAALENGGNLASAVTALNSILSSVNGSTPAGSAVIGGVTLAAQTPITPAAATATSGLQLGGQAQLQTGQGVASTAIVGFTNGQQGAVLLDQNGALPGLYDGATFAPASVSSAVAIFTQDMTGYAAINVQVNSAGGGSTITYQTSEDNVNFFSTSGIISAALYNSGLPTTTTTTTGLVTFPKRGRYFRAVVTAYVSGTVTVLYNLSKTVTPLFLGAISPANASGQGGGVGGVPWPIGVVGRTSNSSSVTDGSVSFNPATLAGVQIIYPWSIPDATWQTPAAAGGIINSTTAITLHAAGAAGIRNYLSQLTITSNGVASSTTEIVVLDGATVIWRDYLITTPQNTIRNVMFTIPLRGSAATAMSFQTLTAQGAGSALYVDAIGFQGP
jgi:hypothetical protein